MLPLFKSVFYEREQQRIKAEQEAQAAREQREAEHEAQSTARDNDVVAQLIDEIHRGHYTDGSLESLLDYLGNKA